mmetsp:Transcript_10491/g.28901  ORF Transcript_10491/g.28901 Transcript_10491/m.28901 type:complete len:255 (+) Transcript_10491:1426-2190(+)
MILAFYISADKQSHSTEYLSIHPESHQLNDGLHGQLVHAVMESTHSDRKRNPDPSVEPEEFSYAICHFQPQCVRNEHQSFLLRLLIICNQRHGEVPKHPTIEICVVRIVLYVLLMVLIDRNNDQSPRSIPVRTGLHAFDRVQRLHPGRAKIAHGDPRRQLVLTPNRQLDFEELHHPSSSLCCIKAVGTQEHKAEIVICHVVLILFPCQVKGGLHADPVQTFLQLGYTANDEIIGFVDNLCNTVDLLVSFVPLVG